MPVDNNVLALVRNAGLQFILQENDLLHLVIDKKLGGSPYLQPYECTLSAGATNEDVQWRIDDTDQSGRKFLIPDNEIWVVSRISHRDIEPSIFDVRIMIDGAEVFPNTRMESCYYLLEFPKPIICLRCIEVVVTNQDVTTKTYRHLRYVQRYGKNLVDTFLIDCGLDRLR